MTDPDLIPIENILDEARNTAAALRKALPSGDFDHLPQVRGARALADEYGNLIALAKKLHSGDTAKQDTALRRLTEICRERKLDFPEYPQLYDAQQFVKKELLDTTEIAKEHLKNAEKWTNLGKTSGFLSRWFHKHNQWLEGKSHGSRIAFSVGEMLLGSAFISKSGQWIMEAVSGQEQQSRERPDGSLATIRVTLPTSRRVLDAALSVGGMAIGVAGLSAGLYSLSRNPN